MDLFERAHKEGKRMEAEMEMGIDGEKVRMQAICTPNEDEFNQLSKKEGIFQYRVKTDGKFIGCVLIEK